MSKTFTSRLLVWTVICCISAVPSFYWAAQEFRQQEHIVAMLLGVAIFILTYTFISGTAYAQRLHQRPLVRRTLYVGYGTRIVLSILFPVALALDFACGIVSGVVIGVVFEGLPGGIESFVAILAWTLVQGTVLNVVLLFYMMVVYSFLSHYCKHPEGKCESCGYDLRASSERCPECGKSFDSM